MATEEMTKAPCNRCGPDTQHTVRHSSDVSEPHPNDPQGDELDWVWVERYSVLQCRGCDSISIRRERRDPETGEEDVPTYYPPRIARRLPSWLDSVPQKIRAVLHEIYSALAAECPRLAAMGARTVLDSVFLETVGDIGPFRAKLEALQTHGYISQLQREHLEPVLDTGSAAAHRGFAPSSDLVNQMMDIVENLLQTVYVLKHSARRLKQETPLRRIKKRQRPAV